MDDVVEDGSNIPCGLAPQDVSRLLQACPGLRELTVFASKQ